MNAKQLSMFDSPVSPHISPIHALFADGVIYVTKHDLYTAYKPYRAHGYQVRWVDPQVIAEIKLVKVKRQPVRIYGLLPAPPQPKIAGLLPARVPSSIKTYGLPIGTSIKLAGITQNATITRIFDKFGDTYAECKFTIGKHHMTITRKLSEIEEKTP